MEVDGKDVIVKEEYGDLTAEFYGMSSGDSCRFIRWKRVTYGDGSVKYFKELL